MSVEPVDGSQDIEELISELDDYIPLCPTRAGIAINRAISKMRFMSLRIATQREQIVKLQAEVDSYDALKLWMEPVQKDML